MTSDFKETYPLIYITKGWKKGFYGYLIQENKHEVLVYIPDIKNGHDGSLDMDFVEKYNLIPNKFWFIRDNMFKYVNREYALSLQRI